MATVQLSDLIIPEVYSSYQAVDNPEKSLFVDSGIVVTNAMLSAKANTGGDTINVPFWNDLDPSEAPNLSNDNPSDVATPNKLTTGKQVARIAYLNQWYSASDLAGEIAGSDPMARIRNRFGTYWKRQFQRRLIAACNGVLAGNVANNSGDMVLDIAAESVAAQTESTKFNLNAFVDAAYTMGDMAEDLVAVGCHSHIMAQMVKNDDIVYIPDSQGMLTIPTYRGLRVIVDDSFTVTEGTTDGYKYTTVLFGRGAFGYGEGSAKVPVEIERYGMQGNGAGVEYLGERKTWLLHPFGFKAVGEIAGQSATLAELAADDAFERVVPRKNVPMAFLITN